MSNPKLPMFNLSTFYDFQKMTEHATYKSGSNGLPSTGIPYVLVNGITVFKNSKVLKNVFPEQPIRFPVEEKGRYQNITEENLKDQNLIETSILRNETLTEN